MAKQRKRPMRPDAQPQAGALTAALGYSFEDPELLRLALTHRSFVYEETPAFEAHAKNGSALLATGKEFRNAPGSDNEQLEFLGDAILGFLVTELLFAEFPDRSEGELTRMRAFLVSRERLAALGTELGLAPHLLLGRSAEANAAREKPAVLADLTEAVLAAVYLDARAAQAKVRKGAPPAQESPIAVVRELVRRKLLEPALDELREALRQDSGRGALRDPKTLLQERVQAENAGRLSYVDVGSEGPPHQRRFTVEARLQTEESTATLARAEGGSKKEAQQRAAESALATWPQGAGQPSPTPGEALQTSGAEAP